ncbi:hypothetical protein BH11VER1_BH11VER1_24830 [soil metagenome]
MKYIESITDFFKSPKWTMNMLLGAVCAIIPFVGPMVLMGWLLNGFWGRSDEKAETFPDFNFDQFGKNLERGLWPTLVSMVGGFVLVPVMGVVALVSMLVLGGAASVGGGRTGGGLAILMMLMIGVVMLVLIMALMFILTPMVLRAALTQDFASAFNLPFVKQFLSLTKTELALSMLFMGVAGIVLMVVSSVPCIGILLIFPVVPVINFGWIHLTKQLYKLYLSRGGEEISLSPKLTDAAPPSVM